jgi:hypothetical protein
VNTNVWLATENHLCRPSARRSAIGTRNRLSRTAAWDLAGLFAAGIASTAFFTLAFVELSEPPGTAAIVHASPSPAPASRAELQSVAAVLTPHAARVRPRPLSSSPRASSRSPQSSSASVQSKPQSKIARLILGNGEARVMPFPVPALPERE